MSLIGDNIKRLRKGRRMRQSELAEWVGVSKQTISSWEIGRTEPNLEKIEAICVALHCNKSDIYEKKHGKREQMNIDININLDTAIDELSDLSDLINETVEKLKEIRSKYEGSEE